MDIWFFLMEFVLLLGTAFLLGVVAEKLRQSPILGYILSGVLVGPFMASSSLVNQMSELGVSLLLFSIGLEFSFRQLRQLGALAFGGGGLQVFGTLAVVTLMLLPFYPLPSALAVGAIVALSSTTLVLRVLADRSAMDSVQGRSSLSILLFQDIAIVPLVLMISLLGTSSGETGILVQIGKLLISMAGLILLFYGLLYHLIPYLLASSRLFANRELMILLAISVGLGATWSAHAIGISPALGAFIAGMLLGESPFATQIRSDIGAVRTIMVTLFFASVGMLAKPLWFLIHLHWVLVAALCIFLLKAVLIFCVARLFGLNRRHALATGITLGQVGEFSFVLTTAARDGGILDPVLMDLIFSVIIVLMLATPYMAGYALAWSDRLLALVTRNKKADSDGDREGGTDPGSRVLVVGFGPAGRHVAHTLKDHGLCPVVVDVNPRSRSLAEDAGLRFHLGDAAQEEILVHAGVRHICMAVVTIPDPDMARQIIRMIRGLRPDLTIVARCRYNRHLSDLTRAGASLVVDEETSVGETLSRKISEGLSGQSGIGLACRIVEEDA